MKIFLLLVIFTLTLNASKKQLENVSLQLVWLDQFQFAGYYMAKEKNFYKDEGLTVDIKKFKYSMNTVEEVLSGRATFGVGRSSLIRERSQGKKVVLLSAIFQSSPFMLLSLESSNIHSIKDFAGKTLMLTKNAVETASIHAMILSNGAKESSMVFKEHNFNFEEFINGKVDLYAGYTSNEPYILEQRGIPYKIFSPKDKGFDFYSDLLFTSQKEIRDNPSRVDKFKKASLRGWEYAFNNIEETVKLIHEKYNSQNKTIAALTYEANKLKELAISDGLKLGNISKKKILRIFDVYKIMGLTKNTLDIHNFIFNNYSNILSIKEQNYLRDKKEIKICVLPSSLPYSGIKDGKFVGIGAGVLKIASKHITTPFKLVETSSWQNSLDKAEQGECDLLPIAEATPSRKEYLNFSTPYYEDPLVLVTNSSKNYILDIGTILDKKFSVIRGNSYIEILQKKYPTIKLSIVSSRKEAYDGVQSGKYYAHIDIMMSAAYYMQNYSKIDLKISGQFEDNVKISFGIKKNDKILLGIFEKIAHNIQAQDIQKIINKWVSINYTNANNFKNVKKIFILLFIITSMFLYRQYLLNKKNKQLERLQDELVELNKSLESKVADALSERIKKDAYLLHQSRLAQMGEMLSMIAHQWKQPLSSISTTQIAIRMSLELEKYDLNDEKQRKDFLDFLHTKLDKIEIYTNNLSQIITDFGDFYKPNKKSETLKLDKMILKSKTLFEDSLRVAKIDVTFDLNSDYYVEVHENEFMQVILNIVNNAKEQLINNNISNAKINIKTYSNEENIFVEILDNANGIDTDIIQNIFNPYFSTKLEKNGTGLGLYMSKIIIKDYHNGDINVKNFKDGAMFTIKIKKKQKRNNE